MSLCPDCKKPVKENALRCRCGWRALNPPSSNPAQRWHSCEAYGCPLAGTWSNSTNGSGPWWCFVHAALDTANPQDVTNGIRARDLHFRLLAWVYGSAVIDWTQARIDALADRMSDLGHPELVPMKGTTKGLYAREVEQATIAAIRAEARQRVKKNAEHTPEAMPDFLSRVVADQDGVIAAPQGWA